MYILTKKIPPSIHPHPFHRYSPLSLHHPESVFKLNISLFVMAFTIRSYKDVGAFLVLLYVGASSAYVTFNHQDCSEYTVNQIFINHTIVTYMDPSVPIQAWYAIWQSQWNSVTLVLKMWWNQFDFNCFIVLWGSIDANNHWISASVVVYDSWIMLYGRQCCYR